MNSMTRSMTRKKMIPMTMRTKNSVTNSMSLRILTMRMRKMTLTMRTMTKILRTMTMRMTRSMTRTMS